MSDPKKSAWGQPVTDPVAGPVLEPRTPEELRQKATDDLAELDDIITRAGGFPGDPDTAWPARPEPDRRDAPAPLPDPDPAARRALYADLLKAIAGNPEDGSVVIALTADEYAQEIFAPTDATPKE